VTPTTYTVLICTRNRADTLARALASHLDLAVPPGVTRDLLVVDNGSTDHTAAVVEAFRRTAPFPVTYLREDREGHSVALNAGCRAATGDVVVFTDDDAFPDPGWLAAAHDGFTRLGADWVYGPVVPRWTGGPAPAWYGPATAWLVACLDHGPAEFVATHPGQTFFGVNHAARRDRLFALGLYREDLGLLPGGKGRAGNDDDLFARALAAGYRLAYHPKMRVHHLIAPHRRRAALHRRVAAQVAQNQFRGLLADPPAGPTLLGLPRFYYRRLLAHAAGYVRGVLLADPALRFQSQLQLIRFVTLVRLAARRRLAGRRAGPHPNPAGPS
jgi:glycosyltransferase involved in cell wall biosynthesis